MMPCFRVLEVAMQAIVQVSKEGQQLEIGLEEQGKRIYVPSWLQWTMACVSELLQNPAVLHRLLTTLEGIVCLSLQEHVATPFPPGSPGGDWAAGRFTAPFFVMLDSFFMLARAAYLWCFVLYRPCGIMVPHLCRLNFYWPFGIMCLDCERFFSAWHMHQLPWICIIGCCRVPGSFFQWLWENQLQNTSIALGDFWLKPILFRTKKLESYGSVLLHQPPQNNLRGGGTHFVRLRHPVWLQLAIWPQIVSPNTKGSLLIYLELYRGFEERYWSAFGILMVQPRGMHELSVVVHAVYRCNVFMCLVLFDFRVLPWFSWLLGFARLAIDSHRPSPAASSWAARSSKQLSFPVLWEWHRGNQYNHIEEIEST